MAEQAKFTLNRAWDANGDVSPGAKAYFYQTGTTTPITTYSDEALTTPHAAPVVADSEGIFPPVYVSGTVEAKVTLTTSADVTLTGYPIDPIILHGVSSTGAGGVSYTPTTDNPATTVEGAINNNTASIVALEELTANAMTVHQTAGTSPTFTVTPTDEIASYLTNSVILLEFHAAPTGASTIDIGSNGAKAIKKYDATETLVDIASNDWQRGAIHKLFYDGTQFIIQGPLLANQTDMGLVQFGTNAEIDTGTSAELGVSIAGAVHAAKVRAPSGILEDQKATTTGGGTATSGSWETRDLNTEVYDPESVLSISSNKFTPTVDGIVMFSAPGANVRYHQARIYNVTDSAVVSYGSSEYTSPGNYGQSASTGWAEVVAGKEYRIEHRVDNTEATIGHGRANGFGGTEVYTRVIFWKE